MNGTGTTSRVTARKPRTTSLAYAALKRVSGYLHQIMSWVSVGVKILSPIHCVLLLLSMWLPSISIAQQPQCVQSVTAKVVCPRYPGGGIATNSVGFIKCGKGQCVRDGIGQVYCSSKQGGYASLDITSQPVCSGGCEPGSPDLCEELRR